MCHHHDEVARQMSRREFLTRGAMAGVGLAALSSLLPQSLLAADNDRLVLPHFPPKVKRVVYLFQSGGPSQFELFDYKPKLADMFGQELPASIRGSQRLTGMTSNQKSFPLAMGKTQFQQHGKSRAWVSDLMPHTAKVVDELCFIKSMHTEAINHDPAITFFQTGSQQAGRPSMGSWISYGLGSENQNLPAFVVLLSRARSGDQPLYAKLWGNGFLPSEHQGVIFRSGDSPVYYLNDPKGMDQASRRRMLDHLNELHQLQYKNVQDEEINSRISQYEMAYRMQSSVPATLDISKEPDYIYNMYGEDARKPGTFAANCLLARRLLEKDVRFVQLYHQGWDQHANLPKDIKLMAKSVDQASAALINDLKQRGLLDETLVIWGGEFGRTNYSQGKLTLDNFGRDHHPRCFTIFMAGAGIKKGFTYGATDEFGYNITENPVHVHDLQATVLHLMGIDHERMVYKSQGRRFRLTDVAGEVVKGILA
ncbi:DUF1501 domain-containing protein [Botryobacter ruber]|uniref:DUF1501 domain-containing protein n=1 Tax=Botryobacter ruber TaxID=2171629 RepID=UPI000E0C80FF|nr:DUF1501 domain-containing protein [Botryobacter ruber]